MPGTHLATHKLFRKKKFKKETVRTGELFKIETQCPIRLTWVIVLFQTLLLSFSKSSLNSLKGKSFIAAESPLAQSFTSK